MIVCPYGRRLIVRLRTTCEAYVTRASERHAAKPHVTFRVTGTHQKKPFARGRKAFFYCKCIGLPPARTIILTTPGPNADACTISGLSTLP